MRRVTIILLTLLLGCAGSTPPQGSDNVQQAGHLDKKKELGKKFLQAARQEYAFVRDHEVVTLVNQVGREIVEAIGEDPTTYHFLVIKQNQMNAFAVPGGYIFIFDGLLKKLDSIDALAGVLAHEIAHVRRNHFFKDAKKIGAVNLGTMAAIILAGLAGGDEVATGAVAQAANITLQLRFSRQNEEEADFYAIKFLQQTRYDPAGLSGFFETLAFYKRFNSYETIPHYLSTHPGLNERRFMVEDMVKDIISVKRETQDESTWDWERIVTILRAKDGNKTNVGLNRMGQESGQLNEEQRHYFSGLSAFKSGRLKQAALEYQEAIRINPDNPIYHADLALIYMRQQQTIIAKKEAIKSLRLSRDYASTHVVLGMIAQVEERHERAIEHLEEAEERAPGDPFIQFQLASSYHALSMSAKERFHLGRYYRFKLEPENALRQFKKALTLIEGDEEDNSLGQKIKGEIREILREGL